MNENERTTITVPKQALERLKKVAEITGRNPSDILTEYVDALATILCVFDKGSGFWLNSSGDSISVTVYGKKHAVTNSIKDFPEDEKVENLLLDAESDKLKKEGVE